MAQSGVQARVSGRERVLEGVGMWPGVSGGALLGIGWVDGGVCEVVTDLACAPDLRESNKMMIVDKRIALASESPVLATILKAPFVLISKQMYISPSVLLHQLVYCAPTISLVIPPQS